MVSVMTKFTNIKLNRTIKKDIESKFFQGKAILLVGPRQVGKTTLSEDIISGFENNGYKIKKLNCDNPTDRDVLTNRDIEFLVKIIGEADIVFIDEGQKVTSIGQTLKLLVDYYKSEKQILVTGSSSFNLLDKTQEPLTGRKFVYHLYPLSISEIYQNKDFAKISKELESHLIYGNYPDVVGKPDFSIKREILEELTSSQLYKDILEFQEVKDSDTIRNLLKALALQIGSEVSYTELSQTLSISKNTVERYVDLLEKNFIIFRLSPYSASKRKEITKLRKIYFLDLGVRNTLINNLNELKLRTDVGALWENFLIIERIKKIKYEKMYTNQYFWRTYDKKEVDWVEDRDGKLFGYEFTWNVKKAKKAPEDWLLYDNASYKIINKDNYLDFIG